MGFAMTLKPVALICRPVGVVVGFVYPAYQTYKALESKTPESAAQWLTYWCVFSIFTVVEFFADLLISNIPLYYLAKLLFIVWLMAPQTKGATTLYVKFMMPLIKKHEESIDNALEQGYKKSENTFIDLKLRGLAFLREKGIYSGGAGGGGAVTAPGGGAGTSVPPPPAESKATV